MLFLSTACSAPCSVPVLSSKPRLDSGRPSLPRKAWAEQQQFHFRAQGVGGTQHAEAVCGTAAERSAGPYMVCATTAQPGLAAEGEAVGVEVEAHTQTWGLYHAFHATKMRPVRLGWDYPPRSIYQDTRAQQSGYEVAFLSMKGLPLLCSRLRYGRGCS